MKRSAYFVFICLLGCYLYPAGTLAQQATAPTDTAWQRIALPDGASVAMPATTHKSPTSDTKLVPYVANYQDIIYATVANQVDPARLSFWEEHPDDDQLDKVYEATIKGLIGSDKAARVVARKDFHLAGHRGLEVQLYAPGNAQLSRTKFARMLYVPHTIYLLTWRATAAHDTADEPSSRARYFNSLLIKNQPVEHSSGARQAGPTVGWLVVVAALLAGLFFFVRRVFAQASKLPPAP